MQAIGWHHAEPVLRSLAYALLDRGGANGNPAKSDLQPDRPWRSNRPLAAKLSKTWAAGQIKSEASAEMLDMLRHGSAEEAGEKVAALLNAGVAPQSVWDALFNGAAELLMRSPGIVSLHAVTSTNALHYAWQNCGDDETRRMLLLQNAAFLPLFRGSPKKNGIKIDELEPVATKTSGAEAVGEIFADIGGDRLTAARKLIGWLKDNPRPEEFIAAARRFVFLKGNNAHDYKFSAAVLEDYARLSPPWRDRFLAASVFNLRGSTAPDNELVKRTRAALAG